LSVRTGPDDHGVAALPEEHAPFFVKKHT
jgi:hypothetical protein